MDKFPNIYCFNHETKKMACYCPECVQALCSECSYYHTIHLKHRPVPNVFIKFMPAFLLLKINRCLKHTEQSEFFTSNHGAPCCSYFSKNVHSFCDFPSKRGMTNNINLAGKLMIKVNAGDITGCCILPNGQMIFVDNKYKCLIIHEKDGSFNRTVDMLCNPYDVTGLSDDKIAITRDCEVIVVNLQTDLTEKWIDIGWKCYGIKYCNNVLLVTLGDGKGIQLVDLDGNMLNRVPVPTYGAYNVNLYNEKLYVAAYRDDHKVYCCDLTGKILWTFQHNRLQGPHNITTDRDGFLYIVYETSLKIVVVSPDGKYSKTLLCEQDGLHFPKALHVLNNQLLVCNSSSCTALLYDINVIPQKIAHMYLLWAVAVSLCSILIFSYFCMK